MDEDRLAALRDDLRRRLAAEPTLDAAAIETLAAPSIRLRPTPVAIEDLPIGASRLGGVPDLPPGVEWPRWLPDEPRDDRYLMPWHPERPAPLAFLAQLDLASLPPVDPDLPRAGSLAFFYDQFCETWGFDPNDRGSCHVLHVEGATSDLRRTTPPDDLPEGFRYLTCAVTADLELTLPDHPPGYVEGETDFDEAYARLIHADRSDGEDVVHRLMGHSQPVQGPYMAEECQLVSNGVHWGGGFSPVPPEEIEALKRGSRDWILLLQIDSDDAPGWMWGDCGRLYFWIRRQDLAARRFDDVWLILQCY